MAEYKCELCERVFPNKNSRHMHRRWHNPTEKMIQSYKGENNNNWKGGRAKIAKRMRSWKAYKDWRISILERDNYQCQRCQEIGGKLEVHHIKPLSKFPEIAFDLDNGVVLCKPCHITVDKFRGGN